MKIGTLKIDFENCEQISIDGKYIGDFWVDDIHTRISRQGCNCIDEVTIADTVVFEIHKDANKEYCPFEVKEWKTTVFDRLYSCSDIASISFDLVYPDFVKKYEMRVKWVGDNDYSNEAQDTYLSDCGNMYISIAKGMKIKDFFDIEIINYKADMDFHFSMCDVGDENNK